MKNLVLIFFSAFVLTSCVKDDAPSEAMAGYEYYPFSVGFYAEYKVDSIFHDQPDPTIIGIHDTSSYFLKEVISEELFDENKQFLGYTIRRFKRQTEDDDWTITDVWSVIPNSRRVVKVEENISYIKMAFPIFETSTWDGNALNTEDLREYMYENLYQPISYGELQFDKTVTVQQRDNKNLVDDELAFEVYAANVGLVYRYDRDLVTQINFDIDPVAENIRLGREFTWQILDYGVE